MDHESSQHQTLPQEEQLPTHISEKHVTTAGNPASASAATVTAETTHLTNTFAKTQHQNLIKQQRVEWQGGCSMAGQAELAGDVGYEAAQLDQIAKISRISLKQAIKDRNNCNARSQELKFRMPRKRYYNGVGKILVNDVSIRQQKLENIPFKKLASRNDFDSLSSKVGAKKVSSGAVISHYRQHSLNQQNAHQQQLAFDFSKNFQKDKTRFDSTRRDYNNTNKFINTAKVGEIDMVSQNNLISSVEQNRLSFTNENRPKHPNTLIQPDNIVGGQRLLSVGGVQPQQSVNLSEFTQDPYAQYLSSTNSRIPNQKQQLFDAQDQTQSRKVQNDFRGSKDGSAIFSSENQKMASWGQRFSQQQPNDGLNYNLGFDLDVIRRSTMIAADQKTISGSTTQQERNAPKLGFQCATAHNTFRNLNQLPLLEEAAVSHMMEKIENQPQRIKFTLNSRQQNHGTSDKISDKLSTNSWLHQRQAQQDRIDKQRNDRIIMKRLNQLYPERHLSSTNYNDDEIRDSQNVSIGGYISGGGASGADQTLLMRAPLSAFNTMEQQRQLQLGKNNQFNKQHRQQTAGARTNTVAEGPFLQTRLFNMTAYQDDQKNLDSIGKEPVIQQSLQGNLGLPYVAPAKSFHTNKSIKIQGDREEDRENAVDSQQEAHINPPNIYELTQPSDINHSTQLQQTVQAVKSNGANPPVDYQNQPENALNKQNVLSLSAKFRESNKQNLIGTATNHAGQEMTPKSTLKKRTSTQQPLEDYADDAVVLKREWALGLQGNAGILGDYSEEYGGSDNRRGARKSLVMEDQSDEELIAFSSGNIYNANSNPQVKKFVAQVAGFLENTDNHVKMKKEHMARINLMMKQTKNAYIQTLLEGEEKKHCTGIQKRFMETKYNVRQHQQLQPEEDEVSIIKEQKKLKDKEKILERKQRALEKVENFWRCQSIGSSMPLKIPENLMPNYEEIDNPAVITFVESQIKPCILNNPDVDKKTNDGDCAEPTQRDSQPDLKNKKKLETQNLIVENEKQPSSNKSSRRNTVAEYSTDTKLKIIQLQRKQQQRMTSVPHNLKIPEANYLHRTGTYLACQQALDYVDKSKHQAAVNLQQKKQQQQQLNKKIKVFKDAFCMQRLPEPYDQELEELLKADSNNHHKFKVIQNLNILIKHLSTEKFERQRPLTNKKIQAQFKPKPLILNAQDLGLEQQNDFKELSAFLFRGSNFTRVDHREFSKQAFREHLNDRYSRQITERIMLVLESQNMIKPQMSEMDYAQMICDMLNLGPEFYKKLLFACLSKQNPGRVCEHDIFSLLQTFKQIDSYYFYKELINRREVPRDFKDVKDNSDQIFFEAFAPDIIEISHTMSIRKRLLGIFDNDHEKEFMNDIPETSFETYQEYEEEIVRQIEYTASIISKTYPTKNSLLTNVLDILLNERDLLKIRAKFIQMVIDKKILNIGTKKKQSDLMAEQKSSKQINVQTLFKPPSTISPCIGQDASGCRSQERGGDASNSQSNTENNRTYSCIYMNYDDFMKLIEFPEGTVSSFMDDFIDHLTAGCVSLKHFEEHLGVLREYERENRDKKPQAEPKNYLEGTTVIEYLEKKNIEEYGNCLGELSYSIQAKRTRQGKTERKNTRHIVDQPYQLQDHLVNGEFGGRLLIQNPQQNLTAQKERNKSASKGKRKVSVKLEESDSSDDSEKDNLRKTMGKAAVVHVTDDQIIELIEYRQFFQDPNFFKIFRIFYALAVVPEDAQNNPFLIFLDRESVIRNFSKVFGIENEEIAIRFYCLLLTVKNNPPRISEREVDPSHKIERKKGEIDVVQFLRATKYLCHTKQKQSTQFLKLAFRFMDYDDNGSIGSVDILNLKKSFDQNYVEKIYVLFEKEQIKKSLAKRIFQVQEKANIQKKLQKQLMMQWVGKKSGLGKLGGALSPNMSRPSSIGRSHDNEDANSACDSVDLNYESNEIFQGTSPEVQRVLNDPWNRFLLEVAQLRDYFVQNANQKKKNSDKSVQDQNFLTLHNYQHNFLVNFNRKYDLKSPTIIHFFKSKFEYPKSVELPEDPSPEECFQSFDAKLEKYCKFTDEIYQMQDMLEQVTRHFRFQFKTKL